MRLFKRTNLLETSVVKNLDYELLRTVLFLSCLPMRHFLLAPRVLQVPVRMLTYLINFAHDHLTFRWPEVDSVTSLLNLNTHRVNIHKFNLANREFISNISMDPTEN